METPARFIYEGDGSNRKFTIPTQIKGDDYVRIEIDTIYQSDRSLWDIVNNSIIFTVAPAEGAVIDIQVATSEESLGQLGSTTNVDIVAESIDDINELVVLLPEFNNRYLGSKTTDPTLDNDGNTLLVGTIYWNSDFKQMRVWSGTAWVPMSTGSGASGGGVDQVFYENDQAVTTSYSITSGKNAMSAGPIIVDDGVTVTVPSGSTWTVV